MLKVKEILHSQFRYVFPDLVKKDILTIDDEIFSVLENNNTKKENKFFSSFKFFFKEF